MDIPRLLRFLRLTASEHDGEALAAVRAANKLLAACGAQWDDVLAPQSTNSFPAASIVSVVVDGRRYAPPLVNWSRTASWIAAHLLNAYPAPSLVEGERLDMLCIRLRAGHSPDAEEAGLLLSLYRRLGGTV